MTDSYEFHTLDVFTERRFGGNPLAVLTDARGLTTAQMTAIAREFNLSETVFVMPPDDPAHSRRVRIFTPGRELPFAGHPTIGTAHLLVALGAVPVRDGVNTVVLEEGVGPVSVSVVVDSGEPVSAELTAAQEPETRDAPDAGKLAAALSLSEDDVVTDYMAPAIVSCGVPFVLVPLRDRDAVARAAIDTAAWRSALDGAWSREIFLFDAAAARDAENIRARMFAPSLGVGEDPATGSAAASFAAYLAGYADERDATLRWTVEQGFEMGRPSMLFLTADKRDGKVTAVRVAGSSVMVSRGELRVA